MSVEPSTSSLPRILSVSMGPSMRAKKLTNALPNATDLGSCLALMSCRLRALKRMSILTFAVFEKSMSPCMFSGSSL